MSSESRMLWAILIVALVLLLGILYLGDPRFHQAPQGRWAVQIKTIAGAAFLVAGLLFVIAILGFTTGEGLVIYLSGRPGLATVQVRYADHGFSDSDYTVSYVYEVDGQMYAASQSVSGGTYNRLEPGTEVRIRYLAATPVHSRLVGRDMDWLFQLLQAVPAACFGALVIMVVVAMVQKKQKVVDA